MYSNKKNVNILTALLVKGGIRDAVVCPGSRNAPIVNNLNETKQIRCHAVTDERSAGFYALGIAQATARPVVVCVTSGTALLNLLPAVAEARYQHQSIIVISADRPQQWIDQLDGQTIVQPGALGRFVRTSVSLPEPADTEGEWYCNRLVNEALLAATHHGKAPVHINVPISGDLYAFTEKKLPDVRLISRWENDDVSTAAMDSFMEAFTKAKRPMIVIGHMAPNSFDRIFHDINEAPGLVWITEVTAPSPFFGEQIDAALDNIEAGGEENIERFLPDTILYIGGALISNRLKAFLRRAKDARTFVVNEDGAVTDTFCHLTDIIECDPVDFLRFFLQKLPTDFRNEFMERWEEKIWAAKEQTYAEIEAQKNKWRPDTVLMRLNVELNLHGQEGIRVQAANSMPVRLCNRNVNHVVWCNRGINGIDGSLSTAAGMALASENRVLCIIGDLSFFYDENALWNKELGGNFRVLLLNNGGGEIFSKFDGLKDSGARPMVMGTHKTSAEGICKQNNCLYFSARNLKEYATALPQLLASSADKPVVLEVFI